jgi:hypothetical protein
MANAPTIFFLSKNSFFGGTELKRGKKKKKYFQNDYLGSVKSEKS